jgi:hypothetical protein
MRVPCILYITSTAAALLSVRYDAPQAQHVKTGFKKGGRKSVANLMRYMIKPSIGDKVDERKIS